MNSAANGTPAFAVHDAIALYGDKLKPRVDQRKGGNGFGINEEGAGYTLTGVDRHGVAYGIDQQGGKGGANSTEGVAPTVLSDSHGTPHGVAYSGAVGGGGKDDVSEVLTARSYKGIGARNGEISGVFAAAKVQCYENHAQDSRVQGPIDTAPTFGSSNANSAGVSGNNPLAVFVKTSHAKGKDGEGERWDNGEVAQTRNTFDIGDKRSQEVVVSANSNGVEFFTPGLTPECSPTLKHGTGDHRAAVLVNNKAKEGAEGNDADPKVAYGINPVMSGVMMGTKPAEETAQTLCKSSGGENGVVQTIGFKAGQSKDGGLGDEREVSPTLTHKPSALEPTLAQSQCDLSQMRYIVRRLTPTEAERLMGLPDGYTIPRGLKVTDELVAEFQRIHDTFKAIMYEYAVASYERSHREGEPPPKPPKPKAAYKIRAWLEKITATCPDSPRYKACGNGMATNQPRWIFTRMLAKEGIEW